MSGFRDAEGRSVPARHGFQHSPCASPQTALGFIRELGERESPVPQKLIVILRDLAQDAGPDAPYFRAPPETCGAMLEKLKPLPTGQTNCGHCVVKHKLENEPLKSIVARRALLHALVST